MYTWLRAFLITTILASVAYAQTSPPLRIEEVDGNPSAVIRKIIVNNSTLSVTGGVATIPTINCSSTVASLTAAAASSGKFCVVTDGNAANDCTVGGGSTRVPCASNGSAWVPLNGGGGADNMGNMTATAALEMGSYSIDGSASTGLAFNLDNDTTVEGRWDASGHLGVGTTNPSATLHLVNDSTTNIIEKVVGIASQTADFLQVSTSGGTRYLGIKSDGKIGIGTSAPTEKLEIASGNLKVGGTITTTGSGDSYIDFTQQASAPTTPAAGHMLLYADTDDHAYQVTDDGTATALDSAGGGGGSGVGLGQYINLIIAYGSATTATITADSVTLYDSSNVEKVYNTVSKTCTITTSGIGGLEASDSEASNTWYEIYLKGKSDGTINCLLNAAGGSIGTAPSSYDYGKLLGYVRNNGSSNFVDFYQIGNTVYKYDGDILSGGTATSYTDIDFSAYAPPKARILILGAYYINSGGVKTLYLRRNGSSYDGDIILYDEGTTNVATRDTVNVPCDSSQIIEYKLTTNGTTNIGTHGYILNI